MLPYTIVAWSSEAAGHAANSLLDQHSGINTGWLPETGKPYPQYITLKLSDGVKFVQSIHIRTTEHRMQQRLEILFGTLRSNIRSNKRSNTQSNFDFKSVWPKKNEKINDQNATDFTINVQGQTEYIRLQLTSENKEQTDETFGTARGILSVEILSDIADEKPKIEQNNTTQSNSVGVQDKISLKQPQIIPFQPLQALNQPGTGNVGLPGGAIKGQLSL
ncbi:MAG: hypothetical protein EZS28_020071, partial [Streblomastix strix]